MLTLLQVICAGYGAVCIWLIVRLMNRRERWVKWSLGLLIAMPVVYFASFGPACWLSSRIQGEHTILRAVYRPLLVMMFREEIESCHAEIQRARSQTTGSVYSHSLSSRKQGSGVFEFYSTLFSKEEFRWRHVFEWVEDPGGLVEILRDEFVFDFDRE